MRIAMWALLLTGCAVDGPLDTAGPEPEPKDTGGPEDPGPQRYERDCSYSHPPAFGSVQVEPAIIEPLVVETVISGFRWDPADPPSRVQLRHRLSERYLEWAAANHVRLDEPLETWTSEVELNHRGEVVVRCLFLPVCALPKCTEADAYDEFGEPRWENLIGWVHDPIELWVWE